MESPESDIRLRDRRSSLTLMLPPKSRWRGRLMRISYGALELLSHPCQLASAGMHGMHTDCLSALERTPIMRKVLLPLSGRATRNWLSQSNW
jgi:hypothetical protein